MVKLENTRSCVRCIRSMCLSFWPLVLKQTVILTTMSNFFRSYTQIIGQWPMTDAKQKPCIKLIGLSSLSNWHIKLVNHKNTKKRYLNFFNRIYQTKHSVHMLMDTYYNTYIFFCTIILFGNLKTWGTFEDIYTMYMSTFNNRIIGQLTQPKLLQIKKNNLNFTPFWLISRAKAY